VIIDVVRFHCILHFLWNFRSIPRGDGTVPLQVNCMIEDDEEEVAVAEAAGGGGKLPPPVEVICGDDPERRENRDERRRRLMREMQRREAELTQRVRDLDRRR